ncbi:helix-turn-helix domain-containing protein [Solibacillus sp. MA9]|uniref:Helix-turn-helix domain-containing protein n=1 Tax=Solibacillus palustris TaxID=2908203 RepID=A0ABS9UBY9_9BACL|nr:helix-turn-helix transcriptional regulator [Solibacillus sp. MA9]MCH7321748.1 helix-turn-helix domain-containing protein [Solibacillus sp. MA9]
MATDFARHLKDFRERASITQTEMAQKLNMTQSHISKYETGRKVIDLETFMSWVRATNSEMQAAMIMFGADIFAQASQAVTLIPAFITTVDATQLFM